jgi:hypothetical protein
LAAGEDINFDQYGLWMTQLHRIPMQLVQTQLTSYQDILPGPSSALSELRQAFAGIRMGASLIMQTRGPNHSNASPSAQLTTPVSSVPLQTATVTTAEAMNVDKSSMLPLSTMMINPSDNMNLDNPAMLPHTTQPPTYAQQQSQQHQQSQTLQLNPHDQGHHSSMLQFNQFNIRQTQVRVQVTTQPALCPTLETNHSTQLTAALPNLALNNLMMPLTVHNSPQQQSDLLNLPVGRMITPPMQQLQQSSEAHRGN